tara:strand:- start:621 stop:1916 length:1296 start_codon:yes stop_codon:yes gene_type:complete
MAINLLNDISSTGSITITKPATTTPLLYLYNTSNGGGAAIQFSDNVSLTQPGRLTYRHTDAQSQGGGASFHFTSEPDTVLVVGSSTVNGRFVAKSAANNDEVDYGFYDDVNTGMYRISADYLGFSTGGTTRVDINNSGIRMGNANARVTTILDQNDLGSNSDTALATQQSIKAYVDAHPGSGGTVTSITEGPGITVTASATSPTVAVDYLGTDSIIKAAPTISAAVALSDFLLIASSNGNVYETTFSNLPFATNVAPTAPSSLVATIVGETIEIQFAASTTSNIGYYQVWSSDDGGDYGIIGQISPTDFSSTMTVVDTTFVTGGTMSYRVYAVKNGVYSSAATVSKSYTVSALSVTAMTVVNLNTAYYIQYEKPASRFIDHIEIYMDSQATQAALNRSNASIVYSGQNASYMRNVNTSNNFHQFWVEVVTS